MKKWAKGLSARLFVGLDRVGLHVLPKHFYTPVPDIAWLRHNRPLWQEPLSPYWNLDEQLAWLRKICAPYYNEVAGLGIYRNIARAGFGPGYGPIESQVLHCFIRSERPHQVIEIGSGASTAAMLHASSLNTEPTYITCIEPFPKPHFRRLEGITHIHALCQEVDLSLFDQLGAGDLLFIDSSHAVKIGSEVPRIYLEIIPKLKPGVFIHIHDIYLPYLYPRDALSSYFGWQETVLVQALLTHNRHLRLLCSESALHYHCPDVLARVLPDYRPQANDFGLGRPDDDGHFPSSLWLQTA
jgi:predicted O-methyltransferase YrrM